MLFLSFLGQHRKIRDCNNDDLRMAPKTREMLKNLLSLKKFSRKDYEHNLNMARGTYFLIVAPKDKEPDREVGESSRVCRAPQNRTVSPVLKLPTLSDTRAFNPSPTPI